MCGTLNNAAFSTPCMRLFAANRPNSATPQTVGLVASACLHVITKASQTFNVHAHRSSLPECTKHQTSIIQYINIENSFPAYPSFSSLQIAMGAPQARAPR